MKRDRDEERKPGRKKEMKREREKERVKDRERESDRQTDKQTEKDQEREKAINQEHEISCMTKQTGFILQRYADKSWIKVVIKKADFLICMPTRYSVFSPN